MIELVKKRQGRYKRDDVKFLLIRKTMPVMKNRLNGENSRLDIAEDNVIEMEDTAINTSQNETESKILEKKWTELDQ